MKKFLSSFVLGVMLIAIIPSFASTVSAAGNYGVNLNGTCYVSNDNPFYKKGYSGECTWYCYGRTWEKLGKKLDWDTNGSFGNATDWDTNAQNKGYRVDSTPSANSIAVWDAYSGNTGIYGHVAFVENYDAGTNTIYITECNFPTNMGYVECSINLNNGRVHYIYGYQHADYMRGNPDRYIHFDGTSTSTTTIPIQTGFYYIKSALNENYAIDVENSSTENNANIQLSVYDKNSRSQMFFIEKISGEETYKIINLNSDLSFDITDRGEEAGTNLQQYRWSEWINTAQRWDFYNAGDGYVYIQSHYHKNCIDVQNGGAIANNNIQLWTPNQTAAQKFKLCLIPPVVNISSNRVNVGETVTVTWEEPYGTQYYDSYLTEFPEGYAYQTNKWHHTGWVAGKYEFSDLPAGHYTFFMHAKNDYAISDQSNWVSFDVYEPKYIPTKTEIYNGHKYILYDYEASWDFCKSLCEEWGGHLVTVNSSDEQDFIKSFINNGSKDAYWLGLTYYYTDTWHWITDEAYDYTNWRSSEPSLSGSYGNKEMFAEIRKSYSYGWNDVSNTNCSNKGFILELDSISPKIEISVTDKSSYSAVNAIITNTDIGSQVVFAIYKDNKLIDLKTQTYEGENVSIETDADFDRIKAMLWDSMQGMKPLCPASIFEKNK